MERAFFYVERNLLNGRTFRSLEHLNEVTRWWLANVADVRVHRETKKRPIDAYAEERPHLLSLPAHAYDTALVVYRIANPEGWIDFRQNHYSVPWQYIGELLPVRATEVELLVYNNQLETIAQHRLLPRQASGQKQLDCRFRRKREPFFRRKGSQSAGCGASRGAGGGGGRSSRNGYPQDTTKVDGSGGEGQLMGGGPEVELISAEIAGEAMVNVPLDVHGEARWPDRRAGG